MTGLVGVRQSVRLCMWLSVAIVAMGLQTMRMTAGTPPFQWRDTTLFLKDNKEAFKGPVLFDQPEKYPAFVDADSELESSADHETLPILPEGTVAFPGSRHFLFINEMKFRELFSELKRKDDNRLIRCYVDREGGVEPVALLCNIIESRMLKSGMSMYVIEAEKRIRIDKLIQRPKSSYLMGYVKGTDEVEEEDVIANEELCVEIYSNLKAYLRLAKIHSDMISKIMKVDNKETQNMCLSAAIVRYRPDTTGNAIVQETDSESSVRQARFTCAVANLIQSTPASMQKILEEPTFLRLKSLSEMLGLASGQMKRELTMVESYKEENEAHIQDVLRRSFSPEDDSMDLMPPEGYQELSLSQIQLEDGEMLDDLVQSELLQDGEADDPWESNNLLQ